MPILGGAWLIHALWGLKVRAAASAFSRRSNGYGYGYMYHTGQACAVTHDATVGAAGGAGAESCPCAHGCAGRG